MAVNVALFESLGSTVAHLRVGLSWAELVETLGAHRPALDKNDAPLFSPCEWQPGHGPSKEEGTRFVVGVHFAAFDFDDTHETDVPRALAALQGAGVAHLVLSSFSHNGRRKHADSHYREPPKPGTYYQLRVIFPFTRMALLSEWGRLWTAINDRVFQGLADKGCKAPGHRYYLPCYREGAGVPPVYHSAPGGALDLDAFLGALGPPPREAEPVAVAQGRRDIGRDDLARVARALRANKAKKELGDALAKVVKGEEFAGKGQRTPILYRLVREILDRHPSADHQRLANLFAPSLQEMQPTKHTTASIVEMCAHKPAEQKVDHTSRVAEAFNGARAESYAVDDIIEMAQELNTRPDELARRWIIQKADTYYVLCDGIYRCYTGADVENAVLRDLAPAATVGVDLHTITKQGLRRKTIKELMELYGTVANEVIVDLSAQRARYEAVERAFYEAPCPIRVAARYDPAVEEWLRLLVRPDQVPHLFNWLAAVTRLEEPCAGLYLEGEGGTGKSLLAHGIAKIFSDRPTTLDEAMGTFNESIVKCPVVFADERVPTDNKGQIRTDAIREFIQARIRPLARKHRPTATVKGALRLIMAANNKNLLSSNEHLTDHDIGAFSERFLCLEVQHPAREFIERQNPMEWMESDRIAGHVMWLVENWEVERKGRFLVNGNATELIGHLSTGTGLRAQVCQWVAGLLLEPARFVNRWGSKGVIAAAGGKLYVSSRAIVEGWSEYINEKFSPPTPSAITRALAGLSKEAYWRSGNKTIRMREFDLGSLATWAKNQTGFLEPEDIAERVAFVERETAKAQAMPGAPGAAGPGAMFN